MMLNDIFAGKKVPMDIFYPNEVPEYVEAMETLSGILSELKALGIPDEVILRLDAAQNHVKAVETELMFCHAVRFGAQLQRELSDPIVLGGLQT